jgi:protein involved in polysaccharide export with SLBB domain
MSSKQTVVFVLQRKTVLIKSQTALTHSRVSADGNISMPLIGYVRIARLSSSEAGRGHRDEVSPIALLLTRKSQYTLRNQGPDSAEQMVSHNSENCPA